MAVMKGGGSGEEEGEAAATVLFDGGFVEVSLVEGATDVEG